MNRIAFVFLILCLAWIPAWAGGADSTDQIQPPDLPSVGKWMVDSSGNVSHWLGSAYEKRLLDEPINVIIRMGAETSGEAEQKLLEATSAAGFSEHVGHSTGYQAYLDGTLMPEFPATQKHAFADHPDFLPNNHGRFFGPVLWEGRYFFIGAFSRENVNLFGVFDPEQHPIHQYASFDQARDRFAHQMQLKAGARMSGFIPLENAILNDPLQSTGDHDGIAILLDL